MIDTYVLTIVSFTNEFVVPVVCLQNESSNDFFTEDIIALMKDVSHGDYQ